MDAQKFSAFLQTRRKELGLTQAQLAQKLHVTDKAVSRWERGVGLPDINLLEPLSQALEVSLTELVRSERIETDTLPKNDADAAVAETLALAEKRSRTAKSWFCGFLVWAVEMFLMGVIIYFVDFGWVRFVSLFLILHSGSVVNRLVQTLLYPEKAEKKISWKTELKLLLFFIGLLLYPLIFLQQPRIGLENCGILSFGLTVLLIAWGLWEVHKYVETMPDGK